MANVDELRLRRTNLKRNVTKIINKLDKLVTIDSFLPSDTSDTVLAYFKELTTAWNQFDEVCLNYAEAHLRNLQAGETQEQAIEDDMKYHDEVEDSYDEMRIKVDKFKSKNDTLKNVPHYQTQVIIRAVTYVNDMEKAVSYMEKVSGKTPSQMRNVENFGNWGLTDLIAKLEKSHDNLAGALMNFEGPIRKANAVDKMNAWYEGLKESHKFRRHDIDNEISETLDRLAFMVNIQEEMKEEKKSNRESSTMESFTEALIGHRDNNNSRNATAPGPRRLKVRSSLES